ncbi:MAG: cytochrome c3 family protein [Deltaproteobacteria bacterium]|nr:cytochrome c3 family protein [Deltaproteobacteria bacterium]
MLKRIFLILMIVFSLSSVAVAALPVPAIEVNGSNNYAYLNYGDSANVTVSLEPGDYNGQYIDIWISLNTSTGQYWFVNGSGWLLSEYPLPATGEPIKPLMGRYVMRSSELPVGRHTFRFAVDDNYDGIMDLTFSESIDIFIDDSPFVNFRNCRSCHEHPESFPVKPVYIPDRHHLLVQTKGLECTNCHHVISSSDNHLGVDKITECRVCHEHPESFPVKPVYIPDRHHKLVQFNDFECMDCHRLKEEPKLP